jgi:2-octaprenyl-6-methoxyphenol hydroxylase
MSTYYDILICGAGMVGTSLALALSDLPLKIALTEIAPIKTETEHDADGRSIALTYGSAKILQSLQVDFETQATPIDVVHISALNHFGAVRICASDEKVPALGYVIPANTLGANLNKKFLQRVSENNITLYHPAKVQQIEKNNEGFEVSLRTEESLQKIQARLVIAADGTHSTIRSLQNIAAQEKNYEQSAIATRIKINRSHQYKAYERFAGEDVIALLPLQEQECALIWTANNQKITEIMSLNEIEFLKRAQENVGYRLGRFLSVGKRHVYPLKMLLAQEQVREGLVLIGNAAHTLHPIAAQGFNLGLSDVKKLAEIITQAFFTGENYSSLSTLKKYSDTQLKKQNFILQFTDKLTHVFSRDFFPLNAARSGSLFMLDVFSPLKHRLAEKLMGV